MRRGAEPRYARMSSFVLGVGRHGRDRVDEEDGVEKRLDMASRSSLSALVDPPTVLEREGEQNPSPRSDLPPLVPNRRNASVSNDLPHLVPNRRKSSVNLIC